MDVIRFGLSMRALRRRRGWTQIDLARIAGVSRPVIGRIERGYADRVTVQTLRRIAAGVGATLSVRLLWQGEGLDRLLDAMHAEMTEAILALLSSEGWLAATEVSFNIRGERGSVDILAFHPATGTLLVIEIKSVVPDLGGMLATLDRKARLARDIARDRGWLVQTVARLLVLPEDRTARRRVERHAATFDAVLPARTREVRKWLTDPVGPIAGVLFLSTAPHAVPRHRVMRTARSTSMQPRTVRCRSGRSS